MLPPNVWPISGSEGGGSGGASAPSPAQLRDAHQLATQTPDLSQKLTYNTAERNTKNLIN